MRSANEMALPKPMPCLISLVLVITVTTGQNVFPTVSIPSTHAYFTQQTYPWGFSYSFSEIGKSHNIVSSKTAATNSGVQQGNIFPVPFGIPFAQRLSFVPLPILRKVNESSQLVVPTPIAPNPTEIPKEDDKSTTVSTISTTSTPPEETTKLAEAVITTSSPPTPTEPKTVEGDKLTTNPNAGFYFTHLTPPLTFSYGFTTFGNSPLPIPQLPLLGFGFNSSDSLVKESGNKKDTDKEVLPEKTDITTTTTTTTTSATESTEKSTAGSSNGEVTTEEVKSESFSESTTENTKEDKEENDPNLETETISPIKSENVDPLGKLKVEEKLPGNEGSSTTTTTTTEIIISTPSPTILTNAIDDSVSSKTSNNIILFRTGNDNSEFSYSVKDETTFDEKSHQEQRNGDSVKGKYTVVEPDGTLRTVTYIADEDGFKADVVRKESYAKPFPILQNSITRAPGAIQSLSNQNVLSYYYNGFHTPPPNPGVLRNFGYSFIVPTNLG